jgi:hypothetical protein
MTESRVLQVASLKEFFRDALHGAVTHQKLAIDDQTEHYVVDVLTTFARSEAFFEPTTTGRPTRPLALMLADAVAAPTAVERTRALRRLGDVSLFIAGFFSQSFARRLVDVDYHIAMGGRAYGTLAELSQHTRGERGLTGLFAELAQKFQRLVDVLNEVAECAHQHSDRDLLRLYELWLKTGSARAAGLLRQLGVEPAMAARTAWQH